MLSDTYCRARCQRRVENCSNLLMTCPVLREGATSLTKVPFRVGLYARVSTHDQQTIPLQTRAMREYAVRRGWTLVLQVRQIGFSASARQPLDRENLTRTLLAAAHPIIHLTPL